MSYERKQLGQARPTDTNPVSLVSPAANHTVEVESIVICNTTGSAATYRIFHDDDGTTYDQTTALAYDLSIPANTSDTWEASVKMNDSSGNLAVRSGTGSALTFTAYGKDHDVLSFED